MVLPSVLINPVATMEVNLISDTVTRPSKEMLAYMAAAPVGDDVFKEDPTVNALEEKVARLFGKQAALFFPSGTMANQTAIKLHTQPGEQIICDAYAHVFNYEEERVLIAGCPVPLFKKRGMITAVSFGKINPRFFSSGIFCLENTTNKGGELAMPKRHHGNCAGVQ